MQIVGTAKQDDAQMHRRRERQRNGGRGGEKGTQEGRDELQKARRGDARRKCVVVKRYTRRIHHRNMYVVSQWWPIEGRTPLGSYVRAVVGVVLPARAGETPRVSLFSLDTRNHPAFSSHPRVIHQRRALAVGCARIRHRLPPN